MLLRRLLLEQACTRGHCLVKYPESVTYPIASAQPATVVDPTALAHDQRITLMGLFAEAYTGVVAKHTVQLTEHGLAAAEFEVLLRLSRSPNAELRMSDLAAQTSLTTSGITRLVDRLERSGLLRR